MSKLMAEQRDYQLLSKAFSKSVILELAKSNESKILRDIAKESSIVEELLGKDSFKEVFETLYLKLKNNYRNEYIYKNAIADKIVRGQHKLANISYVTEFRVGHSIADVAVFNGTSTAYEIKTEFDSFERLESQLNSYSLVFDRVFVMVPAHYVDRAISIVPPHVGVLELTNRYSISEKKVSISNADNICTDTVLNCLRPKEYLDIARRRFGYIPAISPKKVKQDCLSLFKELGPKEVHLEFVKVLRERELDELDRQMILSLPRSLTSVILSANMNKKLLCKFYSCIMEKHCI
ncbi:sce7726 family protein [Shewanella algae]|uniref:sce7726 family protein n=1 Tax=Shewanella algae TaxID=38313 RepID=UPI003D7DAEC9